MKADDRGVERVWRMLQGPSEQTIKLGPRLLLDNDEMVRIEEKHRSTRQILGILGLSGRFRRIRARP